jgi:hypothetical protein
MTTRGKWYAVNVPAANTAAVAVQAAAPASNDVNRCQTLTVTVAGDGTHATGILEAVLRDGATGVGTIIWAGLLAAGATGADHIQLTGLDLRSSVGNALTLEFTSAPPNTCQCTAAMAGDLVALGQAA